MTLRSVNKIDLPGVPSLPGAPARPDTWYSGRDGKLLWKTARLGTYSDTSQSVLFAAGAHAVLATPSGELKAFWDQPLQKKSHLVLTGVVIAGSNVVVSAWGNLQAFDAATGAPAFVVGAI